MAKLASAFVTSLEEERMQFTQKTSMSIPFFFYGMTGLRPDSEKLDS